MTNQMEEMRLEIQNLKDTLKGYSASIREWNKMFAKLVLWANTHEGPAPDVGSFGEGMLEAKLHVSEILCSRFPREKP